MDVLAAYREVGSYRGAAAICATTHKTVRRIVQAQEAEVKPRRAQRGHNYDNVTELVAKKVEASKGRISAKRLLPAARTAGYAGSARNFRRLVAAQKALWRRGNHRGRRPAIWTPGDTLVIDWGVRDGLHVFCAVVAVNQIRTSLGRTGVCWHNAAAESFFAALKNEMYHHTSFATRARARFAVADYIEVFYNRQQLHSALGYHTPAEALTDHRLRTAA